MRLKSLIARTGINRGDEFDRPDHIAIRMIQNGEAVPVQAPIERAVKKPVEVRTTEKPTLIKRIKNYIS
jgi:hypothetical protein